MKTEYSSYENNTYSYERDFLNLIENCLKRSCCKTWREIVPDQHKGLKSRKRVDLIFYRKDFGFFGVEGKNGNTLRQGTKFSEAIDQIEIYKNFTYFDGVKIGKWCIAVPLKSIGNKEVEREVVFFIRNFIKKRYGYYLLEYEPRGKWYLDRCIIGRLLPENIKLGGENLYDKY